MEHGSGCPVRKGGAGTEGLCPVVQRFARAGVCEGVYVCG